MLEGADKKLQDARNAIQRLRALVKPARVTNIQIKSGPSGVSGELVGIDDPGDFSEAFSSCVAQVRSVGDAVLGTRKNVEYREKRWPGYKDWRNEKIHEFKSDDRNLMKFINDRRNSDLHEGDSPLSFTMHAHNFSSESVGVKPIIGATLRVNGTGPYWIDPDNPDERHPCEMQKGCVFTVAIINPPTMHRGKPLPSSDPVTVCDMAEKYYTELLREARRLFK